MESRIGYRGTIVVGAIAGILIGNVTDLFDITPFGMLFGVVALVGLLYVIGDALETEEGIE